MMNFFALLATFFLGFFGGTWLLYRWFWVTLRTPEGKTAFVRNLLLNNETFDACPICSLPMPKIESIDLDEASNEKE